MKREKGFTLLEVLLSIASIVAIAAISIPVYQSFQVRNDLNIAATTIAQSLRRAQIISQASDGDATSGVRVQSGSITIFRGASYVSRDNTYDEIFEMPTSITPSVNFEIVFAKFSGLPMSTGSLTLTSNANETRTITINAKGMVNY